MSFLRKNFHLLAGILLLTVGAGTALALYLDIPAAIKQRRGTQAVGRAFTCPMHADVFKDGPGDCPKCGMTLVRAKEAGDCSAHATAKGETDQCAAKKSTCCSEKPAKLLPAGHPPVPGWAVATNGASTSAQ